MSDFSHYETINSRGDMVCVEPGNQILCPACQRAMVTIEEYCEGTVHNLGCFCDRCGSMHQFKRTIPCDCSETKHRIYVSLVELGSWRNRFWFARSADHPEIGVVSRSRKRAIEDIRLLLSKTRDIRWIEAGYFVTTVTLALAEIDPSEMKK